MGDSEQNSSFPDAKQRYAVCESLWVHRKRDLEMFSSKEENISRSPIKPREAEEIVSKSIWEKCLGLLERAKETVRRLGGK